jgi:hypothetical protein
MSQGFNYGQDATVDLRGSDGSDYSFDNVGGDLMSFEWDEITNVVRIRPISNDGFEKRRIEHTGYKGTIMIGRINADFDNFIANNAANYHAQLPDITYTVTLSVRDQDGAGTISKLQFAPCSVWMSKGPAFKIGDPVSFTIEFEGDDMNVTVN